ncbi:SemiSWEET transporter [Polynucleobacter rarus]|jgi:MtN3 and saliva related transmembrane protein|uniref:SemiSWEET transporter n=1 Tax=Polynucleobacter rarus TaxID=556055 RepID=UPI000D3E1EE6|nr:SemiSWEET transporter [Polynucleobacter rarus]
MSNSIIGYLAAFLTTVAFVPQTYRALKSKDLSSISLNMYLLFTFGVVLWIYYGYSTESWPVLIANVITLILSSIILVLKIKDQYF